MIIIGHRGTSGTHPENTLTGIDEAVKAGVDKIEVDVQLTRDGYLVLLHDTSLYRINGSTKKINDTTLEEINTTVTHSGHPIPTLKDAFDHADKTPLLIDCRGKKWAGPLAKQLKSYRGPAPSVSSRDQEQLFAFAQAMPGVKTYLSELTNPINVVFAAKVLRFSGVALNFWTLNPLSYFYAKKQGLEILVYTVNRPILARFIHFFYPKVQIITDFPARMAKLKK